jgi:hydrogenase nickel incorporation protein HypA/HybF
VHELSIAESVVQVASRHAEGRRVTKVYLKVGHLRQVVPSALAFSFELVAHGTPAEGAELEMQQVPATGVCKDCGEENRLAAFPLQCCSCRNHDLEIIEGEELLVESLELEET